MSQADHTDSSVTDAPLPTPASDIEITPVEFILRRLATEFKIDEAVVARIRDLLDAGCSVPFISRYRRDESAGLDERRLYELHGRLVELRQLERRAQHVAINIEEQGKLTPKLHKRLTTSLDPLEVEDLYLRYRDKPKSPTHADEEAGLGELAETILRSRGPAQQSLAEVAAPYLKPEAGYDDVAKVLRGAYRLMARVMAEDAEIRRLCRRQIWKSARITTRPGKTPS
ncbi:MAG: Tex-like N-terminal domain-containing protein, partial [Planctomycetota bacterium]